MPFCRNCGVKSDEVGRFCHECGTKRGEGNKHCYHCGEAGGDNNSAKICTLCNKKAPSEIPDPGPPKRPERPARAPLQRKRSNSGSVLEAALKVAKTPSTSDTEITVEWLAKATGENNASQVSSWHQILTTERITSTNILKRTIDSPYWTSLVLPIGVKVQIETFIKSPRSDTEESEETIGDLESPKSRPSAMNGLKPKSKTLRQVRGEISSNNNKEQNDLVPEISVSHVQAAPPKGGKPLPPIPPRKERKPLAVTIPSTSISSPASPKSNNISPLESPRNKSGPSSPRGVMFAEPSYSHVVVVESSSPREGKNGSISPRRRGDSSPSGIDSSTPRAPPPITSEGMKSSRSDTAVTPPPRPPRRLVRTNSEGASTKSKIEAPPVRRRESDAPEMRSVISANNNNVNNNNISSSEPDVKLVKTTFGTSGKSKTLRDKALNLEINKPVAKSSVGDSIGRILADVTGHDESNQFKAHVSHWEEKPKALDSKKTVTMMSILVSNGAEHWSVFRRYGQFEKLDSGLKKKGVLPYGDSTLKNLGKPSDPALLRDVLNRYLMYILANPAVQAHHYLHNFLMPVQIGDVKPTQVNQK